MAKVSDFTALLQTILTDAGYTAYNSIIAPTNQSSVVIFISATRFNQELSLPTKGVYSKSGDIVLTLSFPMGTGEAATNIDVTAIYDEVDTILDLILNSDAQKNLNTNTVSINYISNISPNFNKNRVISTISFNIII